MVSRPWKNFFVQLYSLVCSRTLGAGHQTRRPLLFMLAHLSSLSGRPAGRGWVHELKHDGYCRQVHARAVVASHERH
jgi:hypothetical protein